MAITTTGQNADGYITVSNADTYATAHFIGTDLTAWNEAETPTKEAAIRQATQYIDSYFRDRFPGAIRSESQALEWPRVAAQDRSGRTLEDVPSVVKNATVELAKARIVAGTNLVPDQARGGQVTREKVDVIEVEYSDGAPAGTSYLFAERLLSAVLRQGSGHRLVRV